jgi:hypothetical protein
MTKPLLSVLCLLTLVSNVRADSPTEQHAGMAMTGAARKFVAALDAQARSKATMKFDDPRRLDWNNIPKPQRKGLQFKEMNEEQRVQCLALLQAALSKTGYEKARRIMSLENNLHEGEKNLKDGPIRDPERYFLTIFGNPDRSGQWGWSFEGHHVSLNFVVRDGQVIADTPNFLGANPATVRTFVPGGPTEGTRTLAKEEQLAFDLIDSLTEQQRAKAIIAPKAPADYRAAGKPQPPKYEKQGLAAAEMTGDQQKKLWSLLTAYNENLADELASARLARIRTAGIDQVYFAWEGATKPGIGHYYRIQGPTFELELINVQTDPAGNIANHIHSVWRNTQGDFAVAGK